jgi:NADPH:quinone reductase-like Zn-dependent oxidoreductase
MLLTRFGGPDALVLREGPDPTPGRDDVRIRVRAAGVNFAEVMARKGLYQDAPKLPFVPGYEVAGVVDAVGEGVAAFRPGDPVLAGVRFGGYADTVCTPARLVLPLAEGVPFERAAAVPVTYLTAHLLLHDLARARAGETVLVHGLGGGVGVALLQLARAAGVRVIGTASTFKHERLLAMGAAAVIDGRQDDFEAATIRFTEGAGVDAVFDPVGGKSFLKSYRCLRSFGRLVMYGASSLSAESRVAQGRSLLAMLAIPPIGFHPFRLMNDNRAVMGLNAGRLWDDAERLRETMAAIVAGIAKGDYDPVVDRTFPLEAAGEAHRYLEERRNFGKVVLVP